MISCEPQYDTLIYGSVLGMLCRIVTRRSNIIQPQPHNDTPRPNISIIKSILHTFLTSNLYKHLTYDTNHLLSTQCPCLIFIECYTNRPDDTMLLVYTSHSTDPQSTNPQSTDPQSTNPEHFLYCLDTFSPYKSSRIEPENNIGWKKILKDTFALWQSSHIKP